MAMHQINPQSKVAALDPIWDRIRIEAEDIVHREPSSPRNINEIGDLGRRALGRCLSIGASH